MTSTTVPTIADLAQQRSKLEQRLSEVESRQQALALPSLSDAAAAKQLAAAEAEAGQLRRQLARLAAATTAARDLDRQEAASAEAKRRAELSARRAETVGHLAELFQRFEQRIRVAQIEILGAEASGRLIDQLDAELGKPWAGISAQQRIRLILTEWLLTQLAESLPGLPTIGRPIGAPKPQLSAAGL